MLNVFRHRPHWPANNKSGQEWLMCVYVCLLWCDGFDLSQYMPPQQLQVPIFFYGFVAQVSSSSAAAEQDSYNFFFFDYKRSPDCMAKNKVGEEEEEGNWNHWPTDRPTDRPTDHIEYFLVDNIFLPWLLLLLPLFVALTLEEEPFDYELERTKPTGPSRRQYTGFGNTIQHSATALPHLHCPTAAYLSAWSTTMLGYWLTTIYIGCLFERLMDFLSGWLLLRGGGRLFSGNRKTF